MNSPNDDTTHFGYKTVSTETKAEMVRGVFDSVASRYDLMNDLMSAGLHRLWKRYTIDQAAAKPGQVVLDLAGGKDGHVILADINAAMLKQGRSRLIDAGVSGNVTIAQVDAQSLPFEDATFDCITMAFGLRNVTNPIRRLSQLMIFIPSRCCRPLESSSQMILAAISTWRNPFACILIRKRSSR